MLCSGFFCTFNVCFREFSLIFILKLKFFEFNLALLGTLHYNVVKLKGLQMSDLFDNWTTQARKGILELTVLTALADRDRYAYELVKSITQNPGLGISEGTIYPLLSRLRVQGLVVTRLEESPEGPARKYYSLTPEGRETLGMMEAYLDSILKGVHTLRDRKDEK